MIAIGSIVCGFILGLIIGSQIKTGNISDTAFKTSSYVVIIIAALIMAWQLGVTAVFIGRCYGVFGCV